MVLGPLTSLVAAIKDERSEPSLLSSLIFYSPRTRDTHCEPQRPRASTFPWLHIKLGQSQGAPNPQKVIADPVPLPSVLNTEKAAFVPFASGNCIVTGVGRA